MNIDKTHSASAKVSGFTLIEVLITVVILSIGLLGMAGIQIQGLRGTTSSTVRSQATILANDLAERIRMNNGGVFITGAPANSHYSNVNITQNFNCGAGVAPTFCSVTSAIASTDTINACTSSEMAAFDIYEFACGLGHDTGVRNLLPTGTANISCNDVLNGCPPGSELTLNISWTEISATNGNQEIKTLSMVIIP